ncbi:hypothetical protein HF324_11770 [Chitinophaga oryzae]|uniref:Uncharacterized protein n=1 Tax=Chitinophaga oryzae TaxID=2725414 RepID=A0AAE7D6S1_9BACT|nr:hypothetical protein [Chitinophaga oryzae]QJB32025.1 hypothetical protein HF329_12095 [Chitinophaga oryzae]QJB38502.1 hypothetical protein HF324_11770 [Chitinophaga oryzae]
MTNHITQKISNKTGVPGIVEALGSLSGSDLSSLLMEVYRLRAEQLSAGTLLQQYQRNAFAQPADTDMVLMLEKELEILRYLRQQGYQPLELSPVGQFGSCAVVGTVSQKKIISAIRHTEVMADATNALALHMAGIRSEGGFNSDILRYSTVHRHIRAMRLPGKSYTPHFKVACMVAAGKDTGNYTFECTSVKEQLLHIYWLLTVIFAVQQVSVKIIPRSGYKGDTLIAAIGELSAGMPMKVTVEPQAEENNYYKGLQFKVMIQPGQGPEMEIADGGFTDWTQQLTGNKKERCLISGIGLSLLIKHAQHSKGHI